MPHYELSKEQEEFVAEAQSKGYQIDYNYSNRFEKGMKCPAVHVNSMKSISFRQKNIQWDKTSNGFVIYAPY